MLYLKTNLPRWERNLRLVAALVVALATAYFAVGPLAWAGWLTATTLALTAVLGFCPACAMVGRAPQER
jgi:hypothetical protein